MILPSLISSLLVVFFSTVLVNFLRAMTLTAVSLLFISSRELLDVLCTYYKKKQKWKLMFDSFIATMQLKVLTTVLSILPIMKLL